MALNTRFAGLPLGAGLTMAAAIALAASPASAAEIAPSVSAQSPAMAPGFRTSTYDSAADVSNWRGRRGWGGGWGRGWRGGWGPGWRGRRGVGVGDVLAGVAIVGGIAAIASAANNNRRNRDVVVVERDRYDRDRDWREDNYQRQEIEELRRRTDEQQREIEYLRSRGLDAERMSADRARANALPPVTAPLSIEGAIDRCSQVVGIESEVTSIDGVDRTASGWSVRGRDAGGQGFDCEIGNDGQILRLDNGGFSSNDRRPGAPQRAEGQWSDDRYSDARASLAGQRLAYAGEAYAGERPSQPLVPLTSDRMPAYPGGPLPGEYRGGIGAGEIIAGALVIGGVAALAGAFDGDRDRRWNDRRWDDRRFDNRGWRGNRFTPRRAIERCVRAAENQARRFGGWRFADVTDVRDVDRTRDGFRVRGRLQVQGNPAFRRNFDRGRFTCFFDGRGQPFIDFDGVRGLR